MKKNMSVLGILLLSSSMAHGAAARVVVDRPLLQGQVESIATEVAKKLRQLPVIGELDLVNLKRQSDDIKAYATSVYADITRLVAGLPKGDPIIKTAVDVQKALLVKIAMLKGAMITAETIIELNKIIPARTQQGLEDQVVDIQKRILPKFLTEINEATIKSGTSSIQTRGKDAILAKAKELRDLQLPLGGKMTPAAAAAVPPLPPVATMPTFRPPLPPAAGVLPVVAATPVVTAPAVTGVTAAEALRALQNANNEPALRAMLLANRTLINAVVHPESGSTLLHAAAYAGAPKVVAMLISSEFNFDRSKINARGKTALQVAQDALAKLTTGAEAQKIRDREEIVRILERASGGGGAAAPAAGGGAAARPAGSAAAGPAVPGERLPAAAALAVPVTPPAVVPPVVTPLTVVPPAAAPAGAMTAAEVDAAARRAIRVALPSIGATSDGITGFGSIGSTTRKFIASLNGKLTAAGAFMLDAEDIKNLRAIREAAANPGRITWGYEGAEAREEWTKFYNNILAPNLRILVGAANASTIPANI